MGSNSDDEDDAPDKKLVGVRVTEERRSDWSEFVDNSDEYNTMAQVIRTGVERVISDEREDDEVQSELEEIRKGVSRIVRDVQDARDQIDGLEDEFLDAEEIAEETVYRLERVEEETGFDVDDDE
jgi:hypothetical protein